MMIDDDNYDNELNEFIQDDEVDERLLPDSDEDIIALMDDNEVMEEIIERLTKERDEARQENKDLLWMLDKRRSSPDCDDLNHEKKHQNHGDICPVLTQYNTLAQKYGV